MVYRTLPDFSPRVRKIPLEKGTATYSTQYSWTEEPGGLRAAERRGGKSWETEPDRPPPREFLKLYMKLEGKSHLQRSLKWC